MSVITRNVSVVIAIVLIGCASPERDLREDWLFTVDSSDAGMAEGWYAVDHDRTAWQPAQAGVDWEAYGLGSYDGKGWYARWFSYDDPGQLSLFFEAVDDEAVVWINGERIGSHSGYSEAFLMQIPDTLRSDSMLVVVQVTDHAVGGGIIGGVSVMTTAAAEEKMRSPYADKQARESEEWVQQSVIYEVYLRSFSDDASFKSLEERLPELQDLGVTVIWLMPIHPIGELNRKGSLGSPYSIMDYRAVNPEFGTLDDFKSLVDAVHGYGMKIIIDLVANHTAWDNALLIRHPDWYTRDEEGAIIAPNHDWHDVADLNFDRHELRKYMIDVMKYWVEEIGIDGYRADVAELVPTDFWEHARHELDGIKPVMMLAEGSIPELHMKAFDLTYAWGTYDILSDILDGSVSVMKIPEVLRKESETYPKGSLRLRFNTNHDKNKEDGPPLSQWGEDGARLTAVTMFVLPGVPLIYNGDEVGNEKKLSLFEKVPIRWESGEAFRAFYTKLGRLRKEYPWLATAPWKLIDHDSDPQLLLMLRTDESSGSKILAALNYAADDIELDIPMPEELKGRTLEDHFTAARIPPAERLVMRLPARGFGVLKLH